jgi:hypothetical protein
LWLSLALNLLILFVGHHLPESQSLLHIFDPLGRHFYERAGRLSADPAICQSDLTTRFQYPLWLMFRTSAEGVL